MRLSYSKLSSWTSAAALPLLLLPQIVSAERIFQSFALDQCQKNSTFTASLFNLAFVRDNNSLSINVVGESTHSGKVILQYHAAVYGLPILSGNINPCDYKELTSFCPLQDFAINFDAIYNNISSNVFDKIPAVAYGIPDLDATVRVNMYAVGDMKNSLACVTTRISNGKTVHQAAVGWATAIIAGIGLLTSALISGLGHSNTASHIAVYALSLFQYFQAIAIIGMCAVPIPPIVQGWTQDFSWSLGIIKVGFLQRLATWYQRATGGTPSTVLSNLDTISVHVLKRSVEFVKKVLSIRETAGINTTDYTVKGIDRVAFIAGMEATNVFMTGLIFYCIFVIFTVLGVTIFKFVCEALIRAKAMKNDRFQNFRDDYLVTLKGIIYRLLLIGFPQMTILCLWEFTQLDSAAEVALAVFTFFGMLIALGLAVFKVFQIARRSEQMHKTPAYRLYADATALNKWGFLYIQFRANAYFYVLVIFGYVLIKGMFVAFGQGNGTVQAVALLIIEAAALIAASVIRPWMDKHTNAMNIAICVMNFINALFLFIMTDVFNGPGLLIGIVSVLFFILNAVFALVLLIIILVASTLAFFRKNPDTRYVAMADNRSSFIKSQTALAPSTELDALGYTARGEGKGGYIDNLSLDGSDNERRSSDFHKGPPGVNVARSNGSYAEPLHSPVNPSMPFLPTSHSSHSVGSNQGSNHGPTYPGSLSNHPRAPSPYSGSERSNSPAFRPQNAGPNSPSPWQRGAGYDH